MGVQEGFGLRFLGVFRVQGWGCSCFRVQGG